MTFKLNTPPRLRYQLLAATFARVVINTAQRMFYPFLPAFSRGLGVPAETLTAMLSARGAFGMSAPFFIPLVDKFGRRNAMLIGLALFCLGLIAAALFPILATVLVAMLLIVVCKFIFDPALQAYLSERTPYARRGLVIGLAELSWSGAVLLGVPVVGVLIARGDWHSPFLPLVGAGLLASGWIFFSLPADRALTASSPTAHFASFVSLLQDRVVVAALTVGLLLTAANESLNVVYGVWLETRFHLPVVQLGLTTTVVGVAELIGEAGVVIISDRLGKRRTLAWGLALSALAYLSLPFISGNLQGALAGIFTVYLAFEFAVVASLPLITELRPEARSSVIGTSIAFQAAGRMIGALLGGWMFSLGFVWNGLAAGVLTAAGLPLILWIVRER